MIGNVLRRHSSYGARFGGERERFASFPNSTVAEVERSRRITAAGASASSNGQRRADSVAVPAPAELRLKESPDFMARCLERIRKRWLFGRLCLWESDYLFEQLYSTRDDPNWSLVLWASGG